jgi:hypothetical protein
MDKVGTGATVDQVLSASSHRDLFLCATIPNVILWLRTNTNGIHIVPMTQIQGLKEGSCGEPSLMMIRS